MVERSFTRTGLADDERYRFIAEIEAAAASARGERPALASTVRADGTWDVTGTLKGCAYVVEVLATLDYLGHPLVFVEAL